VVEIADRAVVGMAAVGVRAAGVVVVVAVLVSAVVVGAAAVTVSAWPPTPIVSVAVDVPPWPSDTWYVNTSLTVLPVAIASARVAL